MISSAEQEDGEGSRSACGFVQLWAWALLKVWPGHATTEPPLVTCCAPPQHLIVFIPGLVIVATIHRVLQYLGEFKLLPPQQLYLVLFV